MKPSAQPVRPRPVFLRALGRREARAYQILRGVPDIARDGGEVMH
jgi:hypothetical protein